MNTQSVASFLKNSEISTLLDIRATKDFLKGHLPNAISIPFPIRLKELRRRYSTEVPLNELNLFIENVEQWRESVLPYLDSTSPCLIYCQSGGLRSFYFHQILQGYPSNMYFLKGGYQGYCEFQNGYFKEINFSKLYVLKGKTGSGKTAILRTLANKGEQVINLSDLAKHQGSVFGNSIKEDQPTSDQFQHNLFEVCLRFDIEKPIFIEMEGEFIGSVSLPNSLYEKLLQGIIIELNIPKMARVTYLSEQYSYLKTDVVLKALKKIQGRLSPSIYFKAVQFMINDQKLDFVALIIDYYDQGISYNNEGPAIFRSFSFLKVDPVRSAHLISECCK